MAEIKPFSEKANGFSLLLTELTHRIPHIFPEGTRTQKEVEETYFRKE